MKKIVLFTAAFQAYSKGDVAGFDVEMADDLINKKKVAEEYEAPEGDTQTLTITVDSEEAQAEIARQVEAAKADLEKQAKARSDKLDAREAKLKEREKAVGDAEKANTKRAKELEALEAKLTAPDAGDKSSTATPPKQGGE
jgi:hypothetical protein